MQEDQTRSDLACERHRADCRSDGVTMLEERRGVVTIHTLTIESEDAARESGNDIGKYVTISFPAFWKMEEEECEFVSDTLEEIILDFADRVCAREQRSVLVVGIGNRRITSDAIGPEVAYRLHATNHLALHTPDLFKKLECDRLSVIAPGVIAQTGVETASYVHAIAEETKPNLVILIDALAARSMSRLGTTIQITDAGLHPGCGIGNMRDAINRDKLGVPTIAIGIPTVVEASTLIRDILSAADMQTEIPSTADGCFISPLECDQILAKASKIISSAIGRTFGIGNIDD